MTQTVDTYSPRGDGGSEVSPSGIHLGVRLLVAIALAGAALLCYQFEHGAFGNPGFGAPVESIMNLGMIVDLLAAAVALLITAPFALSAPKLPVVDTRIGSLSLAGATLIAIAFVAFCFAVPEWVEILTGVRSRFDGLVGPLFFVGIPWTVGLVLSTIALRRPDHPSRVVAGVALGVGLLLAESAVGAAALYGNGITD